MPTLQSKKSSLTRQFFFLFTSFCFLFLRVNVFCSSDISFKATVNKSAISMNENISLQLIIAGDRLNTPRPELPPIPGAESSYRGKSQSYNIINGNMSSQIVYSFTLSPQSPGQFTIPTISIQIGQKEYKTDPIKISVRSGSPQHQKRSASPSPTPQRQNQSNDIDNYLFIKTSIDKDTVYVGEQITLSLHFYRRIRLLNQPSYTPPKTVGLILENLPPERQSKKVINGIPYDVTELKSALFPTAAGQFTIGGAILQCQIMTQRSHTSGFSSIFDDFFSRGQTITLRSNPLIVNVLPLPKKDKPALFKGNVGRFNISMDINKKEVSLHEPITLKATISGKGYVKTISDLDLPHLEGFKSYETITKISLSTDNDIVGGNKTFTTILKPEVSGTLSIPSIVFSFFNPSSKSYETVRSHPITVKVTAKERNNGLDQNTRPSQPTSELKIFGKDIRFIQTSGTLRKRDIPLHKKPFFPIINALPFLSFLSYWFWIKLSKDRIKNSESIAFRKALKKANKKIHLASSVLKKKDFSGYYEQLHKAFIEFLGEKMGLSPQGLRWDEVKESLNKLGFTTEQKKQVEALWEEFDMLRFSPSLINEEQVKKQITKTKSILKLLDAGWKK